MSHLDLCKYLSEKCSSWRLASGDAGFERNFWIGSKLKEYGHQALNCHGGIASLKVDQLGGGFSSAQVFCIELTFEDSEQKLKLVQKFTDPGEVQVMLALSELPDAEALPEVIDYAWNSETDKEPANWFLTPFYAGTPLTFQDEVPAGVLCSLAQLHHYFQDQVDRFETLYRVDISFFKNTLANAVKALEGAVSERANPIFGRALGQLIKTGKNGRIFQALEILPVTLTHGDMHPVNMIRLPMGQTVLIDWGNARIAPAMLDIANLIDLGSKPWHIYLEAWREASGRSMDLRLAQLGYHWATIMVNTMYLPHAVNFSSPEHVGKMVGKAVEAERQISNLLSV
jgi:aminoglycoside phosphotransferase (APT) family kinase protein